MLCQELTTTFWMKGKIYADQISKSPPSASRLGIVVKS